MYSLNFMFVLMGQCLVYVYNPLFVSNWLMFHLLVHKGIDLRSLATSAQTFYLNNRFSLKKIKKFKLPFHHIESKQKQINVCQYISGEEPNIGEKPNIGEEPNKL